MPWMKRLIALMLCLCLFPLGGVSALAEDESLLVSEISDDGEIEDDDEVGQAGSVPVPPPVSIATGDGTPLYNAQIVIDCYMRAERDLDSKRVKSVRDGSTVQILDVDVDWVYVRQDGVEGWMKRLWIAGRPEALAETTPLTVCTNIITPRWWKRKPMCSWRPARAARSRSLWGPEPR